jgi:ribosomal protein L37E
LSSETVMSRVPASRPHRHRAVTTHTLGQRGGVPYEVERTVCATCGQVLDERPLRRAAA